MKLIATSMVGNFPVKVFEEDGCENYGTTRTIDGGMVIEIVLDSNMPKALYWETFHHEMCHAAEIAMGLHITEQTIGALGMGLGQALGDKLSWKQAPAVSFPKWTGKLPKP